MTDELDEESTFSEEIEHNPGICTNCYRRISFPVELHDMMPDVVGDKIEYSNNVYFAHFDDKDFSGRPSVKLSYCECGTVDDTKIRPFDGDKMMQAAIRVSDRLEEEGIEFDEDVYFSEVKNEIAEGDFDFNEEKALETAIEIAIRKDKDDGQMKVTA